MPLENKFAARSQNLSGTPDMGISVKQSPFDSPFDKGEVQSVEAGEMCGGRGEKIQVEYSAFEPVINGKEVMLEIA